MKNRLEWIDLCKGLAIFLVVVGHMIRGFISAGLYQEYYDIFNYIDFIIYSFHMPIFFIISGFLYKKSTKISDFKMYSTFIKRKILMLIIPYFVFSWIQILIKIILSDSVNKTVSISSLITIVYKPVEQFWFLYALMIIFIIVATIDFIGNKVCINNNTILLIAIILCVYSSNKGILGILGIALNYLIYFYIGMLIDIKDKEVRENKKTISSCIVIYLIIHIVVFKGITNNIINYFLEVIIAICASYTIILTFVNIQKKEYSILKLLKYLGKYSLPIYLMHTIFGAGIRIILLRFSIENIIIQTILGLIFGIVMPIIISCLYKKIIEKVRKTIIKKDINIMIDI